MTQICIGCPNRQWIKIKDKVIAGKCCHKSLLPIPALMFNDVIIENLTAQYKAHVEKLWSKKNDC